MPQRHSITAERFDALPDPIFIGGYMRSGTSFVMKLLQGHPHTTGFKTDADLIAPMLRAWLPESGHIDPYTGIMAVMKRDEDRIRTLARASWFFVYDYVGVPIFEKRVVEKTPDSQATFMQASGVFPHASFVIVTREPISAVRSALAHSLLFYPEESRNIKKTVRRVLDDWMRSMEQTRAAAEALGDRLRLVNFAAFLGDVPTNLRALFEWCGLEASDDAVQRAIRFAGSPDDERAFWERILEWPPEEFARRYEVQLDESQQALVANQAESLFAEVDVLRVQAGLSTNRPGLSGSAATRTTASPGS